MSYALDLTLEARQAFALLTFELQERALNDLDAVADEPAKYAGRDEVAVVDFVHEAAAERQYVFMVVARDAAARTIRVKAIGSARRPI